MTFYLHFVTYLKNRRLSRPKILRTDNGFEVTNSLVQNYLTNKVRIQHATTKNPSIKCAMAERANRTLKVTLVRIADHNNGRYIDDLDNVIRGYNETRHSATGFALNNITPINIDTATSSTIRQNNMGFWYRCSIGKITGWRVGSSSG